MNCAAYDAQDEARDPEVVRRDLPDPPEGRRRVSALSVLFVVSVLPGSSSQTLEQRRQGQCGGPRARSQDPSGQLFEDLETGIGSLDMANPHIIAGIQGQGGEVHVMRKRIGPVVAIAAIVAVGVFSVTRKGPSATSRTVTRQIVIVGQGCADRGQSLLGAQEATCAQDPAISTSTDKFTGFTKTEMKPIHFGPERGFPDANHDSGRVVIDLSLASGDGVILAIVECSANHHQFARGADVLAVVDGKRLDLGHLDPHKATIETKGGYVVNETIGGPIARGDLERIGAAKKVEMRIGSYEAVLRPADIARIHNFAVSVSSNR
jgi:hypothetical protein